MSQFDLQGNKNRFHGTCWTGCRLAVAANDPPPQFDTSSVWHLGLDPLGKLLWLAFAALADSEGCVLHPDPAELVRMTGLLPASVRGLTRSFLDQGLLHVVHASDPQGYGYRLGPGPALSAGRAER